MTTHVVWHHASVTRARREAQNGHRGAIIWFTGLSGSGKFTLAHAVEESLHQRGCRTFVLDGDNVRHGLCGDLGFTSEVRQENIRCTSKNPSHRRKLASRSLISLDSGFRRNDESGAFRSARKSIGEMANCAGISAPYEVPTKPEIAVDTGTLELDSCVQQVIDAIMKRGVISPDNHSDRSGINA